MRILFVYSLELISNSSLSMAMHIVYVFPMSYSFNRHFICNNVQVVVIALANMKAIGNTESLEERTRIHEIPGSLTECKCLDFRDKVEAK